MATRLVLQYWSWRRLSLNVRENGRFGPFSVVVGSQLPPEEPGEWCDTCHLLNDLIRLMVVLSSHSYSFNFPF